MSLFDLTLTLHRPAVELLTSSPRSRACAFRVALREKTVPGSPPLLYVWLDRDLLWRGEPQRLRPLCESISRHPAQETMDAARRINLDLRVPGALDITDRQTLLAGLLTLNRLEQVLLVPEMATPPKLDALEKSKALFDTFLIPTPSPEERQPFLYFLPDEPRLTQNRNALDHVLELGLAGRLEIAAGEESLERHFIPPFVPLIANYQFGGEALRRSILSDESHQLWRKMRWHLEMAVARELPLPDQEAVAPQN